MTLFKTLIAIVVSFFLGTFSLLAQSAYGDIQLLINQGQYQQALALTEEQLSKNSGDIKLRFMKGLVLTRLDRYPEAEQVFIKLTQENPELPEPYNNLAVVYAAQGKYSEAENALKGAINTHPSYATAHENLGDIYAKMASRAYNQALELDTANTTAREKLSLVNELISSPEKPVVEKTVVAKAEPTPAAPVKPKKKPVEPPKEPEIITIPAKPEVSKEKVEEQKSVTLVEKEDKVEQQTNTRAEVEDAINRWANAWSAQDVDAYLSNYGKEFIPPKRLSRAAWEKQRHKRLRRPSFIKITLSDLKINLHGKDYAELRFTQRYQSDTYGDKVKKEVLMRKVGDKWLITQERTR